MRFQFRASRSSLRRDIAAGIYYNFSANLCVPEQVIGLLPFSKLGDLKKMVDGSDKLIHIRFFKQDLAHLALTKYKLLLLLPLLFTCLFKVASLLCY